MANLGSTVQDIGAGSMNVMNILIWVAIIFGIVTIVLGVFFWIWWKRKRYNLKVEIKLTRADGKITQGEWGQGFYNAKRGVVMIKRPYRGSKPVPMKIFDVRRYMQGADLITVIQISPEEYRPVLNDSWKEQIVDYVDTTNPKTDDEGNKLLDEEGEIIYNTKQVKEAIINIKVDPGKNKAWKVAWEEAAKKAYSLTSFLREHTTAISVAIVIVACFIGFAVLWTKLGTVC